MTPNFGVAISTHNRGELVADVWEHWVNRSPAGTPIVVIDDASDEPVELADFRFEENAGIARVKNKGLELLERAGVEHYFLVDDDCYPLVDGWWEPYLASDEPHLMAIFERPLGRGRIEPEVVYRDDVHVAYSSPRGHFLYAHEEVLHTVGGMDPIYGRWGHEHVDWSTRIHNARLTTWRFADVVDSGRLIHSMDAHCEVPRSVPHDVRKRMLVRNDKILERRRRSSEYREFRTQEDVVLSCLLTGRPDPQRGRHMASDLAIVETWRASVAPHARPVLTVDRDYPGAALDLNRVQVNDLNVYVLRWLHALRWLRENPQVRWVWVTDSTDVELLRSPFGQMSPGRLYVGCEEERVGCPWMIQKHPDLEMQRWIHRNADLQLLNAGLVGGERDIVMAFLHDLLAACWELGERVGVGDMAVFNQVCRERWSERLVYGTGAVNTRFRANADDGTSWWRHK